MCVQSISAGAEYFNTSNASCERTSLSSVNLWHFANWDNKNVGKFWWSMRYIRSLDTAVAVGQDVFRWYIMATSWPVGKDRVLVGSKIVTWFAGVNVSNSVDDDDDDDDGSENTFSAGFCPSTVAMGNSSPSHSPQNATKCNSGPANCGHYQRVAQRENLSTSDHWKAWGPWEHIISLLKPLQLYCNYCECLIHLHDL